MLYLIIKLYYEILSHGICFVFLAVLKIQAQDIIEIAGKMYFPSNLPVPRLIINLPHTV